MATFERGERTTVTGFLTTARVLLILTFTVVEVAALGIWLAVVQGVPALSAAAVIGLGILVVGLAIEHLLTDITVNGTNLSAPIWILLGLSASEATFWVVWLVIAEGAAGIEGFVLAATVLAVLLVPQHTVEDNALRGEKPFSTLIDPGTIGFSVVESVGATIWLLFVLRPDLTSPTVVAAGLGAFDPAVIGLGILALSLFVEHNIGVSYSRGL